MSETETAQLATLVSLVTDKVTVNKDPLKPYVGLEHIPSNGSLLFNLGSAGDSTSTNNVFKVGDILFGKLRPGLRKSVRVNCAGYCSTDILVLRPNDPNDAAFVSFVLRSEPVFMRAVRTEEGTKMPRCSWKSIKDLGVFCPRPLHQRRIAEILSTVDKTIEQTEALIAKYQQIKVGLMHDLFSRGVTSDGHLRPTRIQAPHLYKESPLGWIPQEWEWFPIGELFTRRTERGRAGLPVMSITMSGGLVERNSVDRRVESNLLPEGHLLVRRGDITYNMMRMWQGVLGRAKYDCLVSPAYIVMKPGPIIDSVFAEYLLSTESSIAWFKRLSYGVVDDRLRLYFRDLVRIRLGIPRDLAEQHAISTRLQLLDSSIQQTAISLAKFRQQKLGLMHDLLTGRVRVKVADN
jgi:type I restriction enzyme, S subunit